MKKFILLSIALFFPALLIFGQEDENNNQDNTNRHSKLKNDFGLSIGPGSGMGGILFGAVEVVDLFSADINEKSIPMQHFGHYGLNFHHNVAWWCQLGVKLNVEAVKTTEYTDKFETTVQSYNYYIIGTVMPSVRFTYVNRKYVRLYSGLDAGLAYCATEEFNPHREHLSHGGNFLFAFDITPIGINIGNKFYIMAETNLGFDSLVKFGIGGRW